MNPPLYSGLVFELPLPHPRRFDMRHDPHIGIHRYVPTFLYASLTIRLILRYEAKCMNTREYARWIAVTYSPLLLLSLSLPPSLSLPFSERDSDSDSDFDSLMLVLPLYTCVHEVTFIARMTLSSNSRVVYLRKN